MKRILMLLVLCASPASAQITMAGPKLTPAQAADVLRACTTCLSNSANWPPGWPDGPTGPTVIVVGSRPGASSWLDFPAPSRRFRLDGSPTWRPPTVYGSPFRYQMPRFGTFRGGEGFPHGEVPGPKGTISHQARRSQ